MDNSLPMVVLKLINHLMEASHRDMEATQDIKLSLAFRVSQAIKVSQVNGVSQIMDNFKDSQDSQGNQDNKDMGAMGDNHKEITLLILKNDDNKSNQIKNKIKSLKYFFESNLKKIIKYLNIILKK